MARPLIFWVEDNADDVLLLGQAFVEARIDVETVVADNGVLAFRYMQGRDPAHRLPRTPDLILLDINLPIIRGTAILEEMRAYAPWKGIPIVILTSSSLERELNGCRARGAADCMTKPSTFDGYSAIVARLRLYLPRSGGHTLIRPMDDPKPDDRPSSDRFPASTRLLTAH